MVTTTGVLDDLKLDIAREKKEKRKKKKKKEREKMYREAYDGCCTSFGLQGEERNRCNNIVKTKR